MNDGGRGREGKYALHDLRSNDFAGTTPGCKGIENDDLVILKSVLELSFAVHHHLLAISSIATWRIAYNTPWGGIHTWRRCGHPC
jgi:hypothetical protein